MPTVWRSLLLLLWEKSRSLSESVFYQENVGLVTSLAGLLMRFRSDAIQSLHREHTEGPQETVAVIVILCFLRKGGPQEIVFAT